MENITIIGLVFKNTVLFSIIYVLGYLIRLFVGSKNIYKEFIYRFFSGILVFVLFFSIYYTKFNTIFLFCLIFLFLFLYLALKKNELILNNNRSPFLIKQFLLFLLLYNGFVIFNYLIYMPTLTKTLFGNWDTLFYTTSSEYLKITGIENPTSFSIFFSKAFKVNPEPYHYFDLWFVSGLFTIFSNFNNVLSYIYIFNSFKIIIAFFSVLLIFSNLSFSKILLISMSILVTFTMLYFPTEFVNSITGYELKIKNFDDSVQMFRSHRELSTFVIFSLFFDLIKSKKIILSILVISLLPYLNFIHFFSSFAFIAFFLFLYIIVFKNSFRYSLWLVIFYLLNYIAIILYYKLNNDLSFIEANSSFIFSSSEMFSLSKNYMKNILVFSAYFCLLFFLMLVCIKEYMAFLKRNLLIVICSIIFIIIYSASRILLHGHEESWQFYNMSILPFSLFFIISIIICIIKIKRKGGLIFSWSVLSIFFAISLIGNLNSIKSKRARNIKYFSINTKDIQTKYIGKDVLKGYYVADLSSILKNEYFAKPFIAKNSASIKLGVNNACILNISINSHKKLELINKKNIVIQLQKSPLIDFYYEKEEFNMSKLNNAIEKNNIDFLIIDKNSEYFDNYDGLLINNSLSKIVYF